MYHLRSQAKGFTNKDSTRMLNWGNLINDKGLLKSHFAEDKGSTVKGRLICRRARDCSLGHEFRSDVTKESMKWVNHVKSALQVFPTL